MGLLEGRVAIVTGAARGIGRAHALCLAAEGACVVANDLAGCEETVATIVAAGGRAVALHADCSDWAQARALVDHAVRTFGSLHALVNNAGVNRSIAFEHMSETDWDLAIAGNLRAAVAPTRAAVAWWRETAAAGRPIAGSVVSTTSGAGLVGNVGQAHYGAAKAGVAAFTVIAAQELRPHGIRLNAIAPAARTSMSSESPAVARMMRAPDDPAAFDAWAPAEVAPLVAWLASAGCTATGRVFHVRGGTIACFQGWSLGPTLTTDRPWSAADLAARLPALVAAAERLDAARPVPNADLRRQLA
ncbi:MAG: SDR family NAD(P)-dependent oxidoreductase [Gammaproteobacteria bacterium]